MCGKKRQRKAVQQANRSFPEPRAANDASSTATEIDTLCFEAVEKGIWLESGQPGNCVRHASTKFGSASKVDKTG